VVPQNQMNAHILIVQPQCSPRARPVLSKYFTSAKSTSLQMQHSLANANA